MIFVYSGTDKHTHTNTNTHTYIHTQRVMHNLSHTLSQCVIHGGHPRTDETCYHKDIVSLLCVLRKKREGPTRLSPFIYQIPLSSSDTHARTDKYTHTYIQRERERELHIERTVYVQQLEIYSISTPISISLVSFQGIVAKERTGASIRI